MFEFLLYFEEKKYLLYSFLINIFLGMIFIYKYLKKTKKEINHNNKIIVYDNNNTGVIKLIIGPMFSGKTKTLLNLRGASKFRNNKISKRCLLIGFSEDNRYSNDSVSSHDKFMDSNCVKVSKLEEVKDISQYNNIFIDEGQLFSDLSYHVIKWAKEGHDITVSALDSYSSQEMWPEIAKLIPFAKKIIKRTAVCDCGRDALLTVRNDNSKDSKVEIGQKDIYGVKCVNCFK